ncbi:hypothetical protein [Oceanobacillus sp. 1P07AA]|uniref:hypothetical protein n=1 Tax=Oceanobacillus sp. 1P07AA TaxID=3132293 RepID=UPI0039A4AB5B
MWKKYILPIIGGLIFVLTIYIINIDKQAISFFPLDDTHTFNYADTKISLIGEEDTNRYEMQWNINSQSDEELTMRQDVSLLFLNGRLKGVRSKWQQNTDKIDIQENFIGQNSNHFESISFHQGEIHIDDNTIRSIQQMSQDDLYVIDSPSEPIASFKEPANEYEKEWEEVLNRTSNQQLIYQWQQLIHYYQVDSSNYYVIPLTKLVLYEASPLPNMTKEKSDQVIGQLWEGLYKNYIIPALDPPNDNLSSFVPLILIDKEAKHLFVLFELNGKKEQLIQRLPKATLK